ncbi:MAG: polyprenol phosphomannose-dependent alpha 1,6 mannosyltransferase MptB [Corynebacterium sp.]|nr:polyprenol phosphomannose-dependent alpha 1,6 mannosyltransferase MptB [Corynebacterium sp.]
MSYVFGIFKTLVAELPRLGTAGSRSASLHEGQAPQDVELTRSRVITMASGMDLLPVSRKDSLTFAEISRFAALRWLGTIGSLMLGLGALGAGALPVIDNPYTEFPGGSIMGRMLQTSSVVVLVGVGFFVVAWVLMAPFVGIGSSKSVSVSMLRRTFIAWTAPLLFTAPLFTQDIYSYLAQGSIATQGMDPYSAGPIDLLGPNNVLARSVPYIWSHSPSPYGPVALGLAAAVSWLTQDSIVWGVLAHRALSIMGLIAVGWSLVKLARRCDVNVQAALWLGLLNPLTLLHLVGGIHNEAIMLGFIMVGLEFGLRAVDWISILGYSRRATLYLVSSGVCISCAGLVKVTGFLALGFIGMALARGLHYRRWPRIRALATSVAIQAAVLVSTVAVVTMVTGIGLGWITGQGGAAKIRSWMSITTDIGVASGALGMYLGLGDHTDAILLVTRGIGMLVAGSFLLRMLFATFRGTIHPVGGLGVATLVLVILFPVVHPWYVLWAIVPLAAWANRQLFRTPAIVYCSFMSFFVLPRGLALQPGTVFSIYLASLLCFIAALAVLWLFLRRRVHL